VYTSDLCSLNSQMLLHLNTRATEAVYRNGEPECIVLCHLARIHAEQVMYLHSLVFVFSVQHILVEKRNKE